MCTAKLAVFGTAALHAFSHICRTAAASSRYRVSPCIAAAPYHTSEILQTCGVCPQAAPPALRRLRLYQPRKRQPKLTLCWLSPEVPAAAEESDTGWSFETVAELFWAVQHYDYTEERGVAVALEDDRRCIVFSRTDAVRGGS